MGSRSVSPFSQDDFNLLQGAPPKASGDKGDKKDDNNETKDTENDKSDKSKDTENDKSDKTKEADSGKKTPEPSDSEASQPNTPTPAGRGRGRGRGGRGRGAGRGGGAARKTGTAEPDDAKGKVPKPLRYEIGKDGLPIPLNSSDHNQALRVGRFLLVGDAPDKDDARYWAPAPLPSDPIEKTDGDEEARELLSHQNFDYDCLNDYPRGKSVNFWGLRRGTAPAPPPIEQARHRLGFLTINPDWLLNTLPTPKKKVTTPGKTVTPRKRKADEDEDEVATDEEDGDETGEKNSAITKKGAAEATYTALAVEVKGHAIKSGFDLKKNLKSRNTTGYFEMLIQVIEESERFHPPIKRILLRGAYDEAMIAETVIEDGKARIKQVHQKTLRPQGKQIWDQERRWLWHAWEAIVAGFVKNLRSTVARESEQMEGLHTQYPYFRGDDDTLEHPSPRDPVIMVSTEMAEKITKQIEQSKEVRRSSRRKNA